MPSVTETFPEIPRVETPQPPAPRKRRWSRGQKAFLGLLFVAVVVVFGGYAFLQYTESRIERMEAEGIVGPSDGSRPREVLVRE